MPLFTTITRIWRSLATSVASSWAPIWKQPAPANARTGRCGARACARLTRRQRLGIADELEQRGPVRGQCPLQCRRERSRLLDALAVGPEAAREGGEVGVDEVGGHHAARVVPLLVHADRAEHAVVDDDHEHVEAVGDHRRELLRAHQEAAVARERHDRPLGVDELARHRGRDAVAHRARERRELRAVARELPEAVHPDRVVAGAVGDDRVGQPPAQVLEHGGQSTPLPGAGS